MNEEDSSRSPAAQESQPGVLSLHRAAARLDPGSDFISRGFSSLSSRAGSNIDPPPEAEPDLRRGSRSSPQTSSRRSAEVPPIQRNWNGTFMNVQTPTNDIAETEGNLLASTTRSVARPEDVPTNLSQPMASSQANNVGLRLFIMYLENLT